MDIDPALTATVQRISEGVYVRLAVDNLTWIDVGASVIVVDALEEAPLAGEVLAAIAETTGGKPVSHVLNTHTHYDHVALNETFAAAGAKIVNRHTTTIPPEGLTFEGPGRRLRMLPLAGCHTDEDCIILVEPDAVLATGDIFGWGLIPLTRRLRRQTSDLLLSTYRRLIDLKPRVIVPGHGPLCTVEHLRRWCEYFQWLQGQAKAGIAAGEDDDALRVRMAPPKDMHNWWRFLQWKHADSVEKVISSARRGLL
ncbi:MAG: MBL fold metallo-hydrolase [Planctomycetaceae bacterium]|nr:MBL fold metallo-hydrolase [Planctomycetaceae bacterium]